MGKRALLFLLFALSGGGFPGQVLAQEERSAAITIIQMAGAIEYSRADWVTDQSLQIGAQLYVDDFIYPRKASLTVLCPDGQLIDFSARQLQPNSTIDCGSARSAELVVGYDGQLRLDIQRGGRQDPSIPYLISPRATVTRDKNVVLRWQHVDHALEYTLTLFADSRVVWESDPLSTLELDIRDQIARTGIPVMLEPGKAYTVDVCVLLDNLQSGCTSDPGWNAGSNLAFYYEPLASLRDLEADIARTLGDSPEALYARAVLLSQPIRTSGQSIGAYGEAIDLLEAIKQVYPDSAVAKSPEFYLRLGELYRQVQLPLSAAQAFDTASTLAQQDTEVYARAVIGLATTTPDPAAVPHLYLAAVEAYESVLTQSAFDAFLHDLCEANGDLCLEVCNLYTC